MSSSPKGSQQLTVSTAAVSLTVPAGSRFAEIIVDVAGVRYRDDGTAPTASVGMPLSAGAVLEYDGSLSAVQFIRSGGTDAVLNILYYA